MNLLDRTANISQSGKYGYTLVEISIVLVILALILGGVMAGTSIVRASQIQAGIHQLEALNSAVNNFKMRFTGMPGDLADATTQFSTTNWTLLANGNGDGVLTDASSGIANQNGEISQFWYQLSAAKMVDARYDGGAKRDNAFPTFKAGKGGGVGVLSANGLNYYAIGLQSATSGTTILTANALTPEEAFALDSKMDDGKPKLGDITASGGTTYSGTVTYYASAAIGGDTDTYTATERSACIRKIPADPVPNDTATYLIAADGVNCQLLIQMP